jgi:hypothetical protein
MAIYMSFAVGFANHGEAALGWDAQLKMRRRQKKSVARKEGSEKAKAIVVES